MCKPSRSVWALGSEKLIDMQAGAGEADKCQNEERKEEGME